MNKIITPIDKLAYKEYIKAVNDTNRFISKNFVGKIEEFAEWHNKDTKNLSDYYNHKQVQRKLKLLKLNET